MQSDQSADISAMASTYTTETPGEMLDELPPMNGIRWGIRRKSQLIDADD